MLQVSVTLTGLNADAIQGALHDIAQSIADGERSGELGNSYIAGGEFTVEGSPTYEDDTINEAFVDAIQTALDSDALSEPELIAITNVNGEPGGVLCFNGELDHFEVKVGTAESWKTAEKVQPINVIVAIDSDEASRAAYEAMYEELGFEGNFDQVTVDMMLETQRMDELLEKKHQHIAGLAHDILLRKDWASWSKESDENREAAGIVVRGRGFC